MPKPPFSNNNIFLNLFLNQLLLGEETSQMVELPSAGTAQNNGLDDDPSHNSRVGGLGLVSELGLSLSHVNLLSSDLENSLSNLLESSNNALDLDLVLGVEQRSLAKAHVEGDLDSAVLEPSSVLGGGSETDLVLAVVGGDVVDVAGHLSSVGSHHVVVVKGLLDGGQDSQVVGLDPLTRLGLVLPGVVLAYVSIGVVDGCVLVDNVCAVRSQIDRVANRCTSSLASATRSPHQCRQSTKSRDTCPFLLCPIRLNTLVFHHVTQSPLTPPSLTHRQQECPWAAPRRNIAADLPPGKSAGQPPD